MYRKKRIVRDYAKWSIFLKAKDKQYDGEEYKVDTQEISYYASMNTTVHGFVMERNTAHALSRSRA